MYRQFGKISTSIGFVSRAGHEYTRNAMQHRKRGKPVKYSLMSLMVDSELRHEKVGFILEAILRGVGVDNIPKYADDAYAILNARGIPMKNGTASFEDMVRFAKENGFDGLNLMYFQMELPPEKVKSIMDKYDLPLSSVNIIMPFSEVKNEEMYQGMLHAACHAIDDSIAAGAKEILLVPGGYVLGQGVTREMAFRNMTRGASECIAYANGRIGISTETLESISVPWSSLGDMMRVFATVPELGYTHDAGNPMVANEDPMVLFHAFRDRIRSVHFKDLGYANDSDGAYRCMDGRSMNLVPSGTGEVDFKALIKGLLDMDYDGFITLEGGRPAADKWQEAIEAMRFFREMEAGIRAQGS